MSQNLVSPCLLPSSLLRRMAADSDHYGLDYIASSTGIASHPVAEPQYRLCNWCTVKGKRWRYRCLFKNHSVWSRRRCCPCWSFQVRLHGDCGHQGLCRFGHLWCPRNSEEGRAWRPHQRQPYAFLSLGWQRHQGQGCFEGRHQASHHHISRHLYTSIRRLRRRHHRDHHHRYRRCSSRCPHQTCHSLHQHHHCRRGCRCHRRGTTLPCLETCCGHHRHLYGIGHPCGNFQIHHCHQHNCLDRCCSQRHNDPHCLGQLADWSPTRCIQHVGHCSGRSHHHRVAIIQSAAQ